MQHPEGLHVLIADVQGDLLDLLFDRNRLLRRQPPGSTLALFVRQARDGRKIDDVVLVNVGEGNAIVLGGIQSQLLHDYAGRRAMDGLAQTRDWGQDLIDEVPLHVRRG